MAPMSKAFCLLVVYSRTVLGTTSSAPPPIGKVGKGDSELDPAQRIQRYWDLQDELAARPNRAPLGIQSDGSLKVNINVSIGIVNINYINEIMQTVSMVGNLRLWWYDASLTWNVTQYGDVQTVTLTRQALWTPEIVVVNALPVCKVTEAIDHVQVSSEGIVKATIIFDLNTFCKLDLSGFPYDTQECPVFLYSYSELLRWTLIPDDFYATDLASDHLQGAFTIERVSRLQLDVPSFSTSFPAVVLTLKRQTVYYTTCLLLPMMLTSYMNTLVFLLPPQSGEKVSYLVTSAVSTSVFIGFFSTEMPRGIQSMPSIMVLLVVVLVEGLLFLLITILILRRYHLGNTTADDTDTVKNSTSGQSQVTPLSRFASWERTPNRNGTASVTSQSLSYSEKDTSVGLESAAISGCAKLSGSYLPASFAKKSTEAFVTSTRGGAVGRAKAHCASGSPGSGREGEVRKRKRRGVFCKYSVNQIDCFCFVLAFVSNSVALIVFWFSI